MASLDHRIGALAIIPPLGLGPSFLAPAMAVVLACLLGVIMLDRISKGDVRKLVPVGFCLLSLMIVLWALALWNVL